ncbi:hypothetical protein [Demequina sp. NBRC 110054]|uniref:hypothetical protein n=1 Tax=Demequina sp. NBRC 110054 TaxID=1570343 RepID=UPI000A00E40C|nr:hypothetical protein [Demequina sp. NBRC 110054]
MKRSNTDIALGTIVVALLLAAASWFVLFSPSLDARANAIEQTTAAKDQNDILQTQLSALQADLARYDEIVAELEEARIDLPSREDPASVREIIQDAADYYGVTIVNQTVGSASSVDAAQLVLADAAAAVGQESQVDGLEINGLVATPVTLIIEGEYASVFAMLTDLQLGDHRFIYVNASAIKTDDDEEAGEVISTGEFSLTVFTYLKDGVEPTVPESLADQEEGSGSELDPGDPYGSESATG